MAEKKTYPKFKSIVYGKSVDVDNFPYYNPFQCWDLVSGKYFPYVGGYCISCTLTRYVIDIYTQRKTNGILEFCKELSLTEIMQPGDICIWGKCTACPDGHIAIYDHDEGQKAVYFLGQNQPYNYVTIQKIPTDGIIGVFRPKIFIGEKPAPKKKADQILTVGSIVVSNGFYVEKLDVMRDRFYNAWAGGWIPCKDVVEVDSKDGKKDQILHLGSGVAFPGRMTVTKVDAKKDMVYLKELKYWVKARCLVEAQDGK